MNEQQCWINFNICLSVARYVNGQIIRRRELEHEHTPARKICLCLIFTWNDAVNADTISYTYSHLCDVSGLNGVKIYCSPSNGTNSNVALS